MAADGEEGQRLLVSFCGLYFLGIGYILLGLVCKTKQPSCISITQLICTLDSRK